MRTVKHALIFVLLGPMFGLLMAMVPTFFAERLNWLPAAYMYGSGPALIAGLVDGFLANWLTLLYRVIAAALVGYLATSICFAIMAGTFGGVFFFGILGVIPAALCSLIAGWGEYYRRR
jgi:hypothetical protein